MQRRTFNIGIWAMAFDYLSAEVVGDSEIDILIHETGLAALEAAILITA